jgi:hypothetical protein
LYIDKLEKIIDKLNLKYLLSAQELEYITHVHYIVFIKYKHLKNIIVDFNLTDKKENIFFKYDEINFYSNEKEMISNGEIFFTTKQIIIRDKINTFSIELDKIIDFKLSNNNLIV